MPRSIERPSGQTEWSRKRDRVVGPSGHTVACGGSWFSRSSDQQCQARHPQELKPEWAVFFCRYAVRRIFGVAIWALVALPVPGGVYVVVSRPRLVELAAGHRIFLHLTRTRIFSSSRQPRFPRSFSSWAVSAQLGWVLASLSTSAYVGRARRSLTRCSEHTVALAVCDS